MTKNNLCNEVLENAIGVHRSFEKIEPLEIMDAVAVQAMEELLEYRSIGTVEELVKTQIREKVLNVELESYKEIGTIEAFKALKEKNEPKEMDRFYCPICRHYFEDTDAYNYCPACGQKMKPIWQ